MPILRIYDQKRNVLALDLRDLLRLLAPRSLQANWTVSPVQSPTQTHTWFEATEEGGEKLEVLAQQNARISGSELAVLANKTRQIIWGEFVGSFPATPDEAWLIIRAVDSTFYEITTSDKDVLRQVTSAFKDVRPARIPVVVGWE